MPFRSFVGLFFVWGMMCVGFSTVSYCWEVRKHPDRRRVTDVEPAVVAPPRHVKEATV